MRTVKATITSILALGLLTGSAVGVAAQEEDGVVNIAPFLWSIGGEPDSQPGTTDDSVAGRIVDSGIIDTGAVVATTDPRLAGVGTTVYNGVMLGDPESAAPPFGDDMSAPPPELLTVASVARRIVDDGGSWSGSGYEIEYMSEDGEDLIISTFQMLTGEGEYQGLTAILVGSGEEQLGWIVPTDALQPVPDLPAE